MIMECIKARRKDSELLYHTVSGDMFNLTETSQCVYASEQHMVPQNYIAFKYQF